MPEPDPYLVFACLDVVEAEAADRGGPLGAEQHERNCPGFCGDAVPRAGSERGVGHVGDLGTGRFTDRRRHPRWRSNT